MGLQSSNSGLLIPPAEPLGNLWLQRGRRCIRHDQKQQGLARRTVTLCGLYHPFVILNSTAPVTHIYHIHCRPTTPHPVQESGPTAGKEATSCNPSGMWSSRTLEGLQLRQRVTPVSGSNG